ncbi:MAG TPA: hypothetical protein VFU93_02680 [Acidimicrobiales bacterium]|nr:hypothetical protein [Acidimicrobiales bacterium]
MATLALLVAGFVLAPASETHEAEEASLVTSEELDHGHDATASASTSAPTSAPTDHDAAHEQDQRTPAAASTPETTAGHGHVESAVAASAPAPAPAVHEHEVAVTVPMTPVTPAAPVTTAPVHQHEAAPTASPGPIVTIDDSRLTAAQQAAARSLLDSTRAAMAAFPDEAAVVAAGYQSIGDSITGFEHFVHAEYLGDGVDLDPARIESIVLRVSGGTKTVVSAMFVLGPTATMADVPDIAGELTTWHDHQNLCWDGLRVVAVTRSDGSCPRGVFRATPPMLHVWLTDQPCGPFSGIEGVHGGGCGSH